MEIDRSTLSLCKNQRKHAPAFEVVNISLNLNQLFSSNME